ncbi:DUF2680 domain-containing protein [Virgibacillus kekensis]|uniref:DUF2680 domain-containing protein n=1 Tax=Virgibacillus kekensis TaxID=202261 RepID=A0ABV9DNW0_9BACI
MKRLIYLTFSAVLCSVFIFGSVSSLAQEEKEVKQDIKLTEEQQGELEVLYNGLFEKHKQIINKYMEYGVFSKEKGEKIISHLEERQTKMKENGYVPPHGPHPKPKKEKWDKEE